MSDIDLRKRLIKLAHSKPELRQDLLPLLQKEGKTKTKTRKAGGPLTGLARAAIGVYNDTKKLGWSGDDKADLEQAVREEVRDVEDALEVLKRKLLAGNATDADIRTFILYIGTMLQVAADLSEAGDESPRGWLGPERKPIPRAIQDLIDKASTSARYELNLNKVEDLELMEYHLDRREYQAIVDFIYSR
jgi:hypothetical protein